MSEPITSDRILFLGDDINTDDIIPAQRGTNDNLEHLAHYALEHVIGAGQLRQYDQIEAGQNFGCGSSREFAPIAIKAAGIQIVRAKSFAEIFYRNSINIGLPLEITTPPQPSLRPTDTLLFERLRQRKSQGEGDPVSPLTKGGLRGVNAASPSIHPVVQAITDAGGLIPFNQQRQHGRVTIPKSTTVARPMTMAEKLLAQASANAYVQPGEVVFARVDLAMSHDAIAGPVGHLFHEHFGAEALVWDPQKIVLVADHFIQINDIRSDRGAIAMHQQMVEFAQQQGCHLFDVVSPGEAAGICHVLLPEHGFIRPGMVIAGTDSHSCTYGAFGCFATGVGTTDMANIFAMGDLWLRVPPTVRIELSGHLPPTLSAKDIMLFILGQIGCDGRRGERSNSTAAVLNTCRWMSA